MLPGVGEAEEVVIALRGNVAEPCREDTDWRVQLTEINILEKHILAGCRIEATVIHFNGKRLRLYQLARSDVYLRMFGSVTVKPISKLPVPVHGIKSFTGSIEAPKGAPFPAGSQAG